MWAAPYCRHDELHAGATTAIMHGVSLSWHFTAGDGLDTDGDQARLVSFQCSTMRLKLEQVGDDEDEVLEEMS